MIQNHYAEAIKHLEQAQQELRKMLDPKDMKPTNLFVIILGIGTIKSKIKNMESEAQ